MTVHLLDVVDGTCNGHCGPRRDCCEAPLDPPTEWNGIPLDGRPIIEHQVEVVASFNDEPITSYPTVRISIQAVPIYHNNHTPPLDHDLIETFDDLGPLLWRQIDPNRGRVARSIDLPANAKGYAIISTTEVAKP